MTAIILAGGKSSRMGSDKAFLKIGGEPIIKRQIRLLREIFSRQAILNEGGIPPKAGKKIIVVTNCPKKYNRLNGIEVIQDIFSDCGPLGGIYSGLKASDSFYNFMVACDMPFINAALIRYMIKKKNDYDIVIPRLDNKFHPLFGVYSKNCIPIIEKRLKQGRLNVSGIFSKLKTDFISGREITGIEPHSHLRSLMNINTPDDLAQARKIEKEEIHERGNFRRNKI